MIRGIAFILWLIGAAINGIVIGLLVCFAWKHKEEFKTYCVETLQNAKYMIKNMTYKIPEESTDSK